METGEKKNIPIRRFPEFLNDGEWISTTLGAEMNYENGVAHENDISASGEYIVVNSKYISTEGQVEKQTNNPRCLADRCDILMVLSDLPNGKALAKCFYVDKSNKYTVNQRICKLKSKVTNSKLLFYLVNRNPYFLSFDDGVKQTNLKKDDVLNCPLIVPKSTKEQEFVAACLSSLDELIKATNIKLEQLKAYKKGLMQKLFPAKSKKLPELRFKEFEKDGEWEEKRLGEIVEILDYKRQPVSKINRQKGRYPYYGANGIQDYVSDYIFDGAFVLMGEDGSVINKDNTPVLNWATGKIWVNNHAHVLGENKSCAMLKFVYYSLSMVDVQSIVIGMPPKINQQNMCSISISVPSLSEQRKIAGCLTSIDEMINQYTNKVALLELYKKGLMQQLFPTSK